MRGPTPAPDAMRSAAFRAAIAAFPLVASLGNAQRASLTLARALDEAGRAAHPVRISTGVAAAERARAFAPLRGVLPSVRAEAGLLRTTDPVATFGTTLRQRTITPANFDPTRLNHPAALTGYQAGVVLEQPLLNADAWAGRRAATRAADAAHATAAWTHVATRADVVRAYFGSILATERVRTLVASVRAAQAHVAQADAHVRNGLATKSDALLAAVRAAELEALLVEARGQATTARGHLALTVGRSVDVDVEIPDALPPSARIRALAVTDTATRPGTVRADVSAAERGLGAALADQNRARAALLPRLNSFARYDWYSAARPFGGEKSWTIGVMASWSVLSGASELADIGGASARVEVARAMADAALARAQLENEQARTALIVALARLDLAERAAAQSIEAHRIVERKYEGGLASVVELLDAQATETHSSLVVAQARHVAIVALAERRQAIGADPGSVATLEDATVVEGSAKSAGNR